MGYYASSIWSDSFVVNDPEAVLDALAEVEADQNSVGGHGGHISWCAPVATYRTNHNGPAAPAHALSNLLTDFGFETDTTGEIAPVLTVTRWGGDKMGSSWDAVWAALADGRCHAIDDPDGCAVWVMRGEDGDTWAEIIGSKGHTQARVVERYEVWPREDHVIDGEMFTVGGNIFDEVR